MALTKALNSIFELQQLSRDIERTQGDRQALDLDVQEQRERVQNLLAGQEETRQSRLQCQKNADMVEVNIKTAEAENARLQIELNSTKHQDDYDAIRKRIMSNRADVSRWEDQELQLFERTDKLVQQTKDLEEQIAAASKDLEAIESGVVEQRQQYEQRIAELEAKRDALRAQINPNVLDAYERIVKKRGSSALVKVKGRACQGCFTTITKQKENELIRASELVFCDSCGRILMLEESGWSADSPGG